jgi:Uma2 family endonuclease
MTTLERPGYLKTPEEYLAAERLAEHRHEYRAGAVYAMAGTSRDHERIAINVCGELRAQLRNRPCEVLASNIKVGIKKEAAQFFYYPDVTVDCGAASGDSFFAEEPRVIFEILSPETERIDRVEKLHNYQTLPSLQAYVLVDQLRLAVAIYRRKNDEWTVELLTKKEDVLKLPEIECILPISAIYERTGLMR